MAKSLRCWLCAILPLGLLWLAGCSDGDKRPEEVRKVEAMRKGLQSAERMVDDQVRMRTLCQVGDMAELVGRKWPDSPEVQAFLAEYGPKLERLPEEVYALALETKEFDGFLWALDHGVELDLSPEGLKMFWNYGRVWKDYLVEHHPDEALPLFMERAVDERNVRFFDAYVEQFMTEGYYAVGSAERTSFQVRYCEFIARELGEAQAGNDRERIAFLLRYMPRIQDVVHIEDSALAIMHKLGDFLCGILKDEELACTMVELEYPFGPIDLQATGFGDAFMEVLLAHSDFAIRQLLRLDAWHGALSPMEVAFVRRLDAEHRLMVDYKYLDEVIDVLIREDATEQAIALIEFRSGMQPYSRFEYLKMIECGVERGNDTLFVYGMRKCPELNLYNFDLVKLAGSLDLFSKYAPRIFRNIYRTMETEPKADGTTLGRIRQVLCSDHHEASLWILKNYDLQKIWVDVTEGRTLLMDVCEGGNLPAARYLVEVRGEDVNAHTGYMDLQVSLFGRSESSEGKLTPLFFAAVSGNPELIRYLVSKGARVNDRSAYGATPLMYAVSQNQIESAKALIQLRADVNATMHGGLTLSEMMRIGSYEEVATAYRRAVKQGNQEMIALLKSAGARN